MTAILSLFLAFMLTIGGIPADTNEYSAGPVLAEDRVLYATEMQMGLVILDMSLAGKTLGSKTSAERFLGSIHTSGHCQYGLTINEELKTAYVGQADKGVDVIKLGNPEIKFVYKTPEGIFREVSKICPYGIKAADNPDNYPEEIYLMGTFPGGIARKADVGDDWLIYGEMWSLNGSQAPLTPWDNSKVKTYLIDREENFAFKDVPAGAIEKPNSPVNNPALYSNVMLDTGEFVYNEVDLSIPGRGFDFVFARTYRSQSIYSGPLGWGWDHNYNKRLVELYSGHIIYYDGTGRRERFKKDRETGKYQSPNGWFVELVRREDGLFYLIYPGRTIEHFDSIGRLIKIQDRNHNYMEFYYNVSGQLSAVMDTVGRMIDFEYYPFLRETDENGILEGRVNALSGRLHRIIDYSDRTIEFKYHDQTGDLREVETLPGTLLLRLS